MDENSVARRLLRLQGEHDRLKEDFVFLYGYHEQETQSIRDEASHAQGLLEADFARLGRENLEEAATLRQRNDDLESQLRYAQSQISTLEQRVRDKRFDADGLLAFLNVGSNEVRGNWPRFRKLGPVSARCLGSSLLKYMDYGGGGGQVLPDDPAVSWPSSSRQ
ncbi:hypothetical protein PF003_g5094 [Phytophthora fragariae]|nr:hypothetical protein PF003_g5094 [Phytophthora fragariae]